MGHFFVLGDFQIFDSFLLEVNMGIEHLYEVSQDSLQSMNLEVSSTENRKRLCQNFDVLVLLQTKNNQRGGRLKISRAHQNLFSKTRINESCQATTCAGTKIDII